MIDIVGHINTETKADAATKLRFLNGMAGSWGYEDTVQDEEGDSIPNPEGKKQFLNRRFLEYIKIKVRSYELKLAEADLVIDDIVL